MGYHQQEMLRRSKTVERRSQKGSPGEIKRPSHFCRGQRTRFCFPHGLRSVRHVHAGQLKRLWLLDNLHWAAVLFVERGAQHLMAPAQSTESSTHRSRVKSTGESQQRGDVKSGAPRCQQFKKPQSLLREGEGQRTVASYGAEQREG